MLDSNLRATLTSSAELSEASLREIGRSIDHLVPQLLLRSRRPSSEVIKAFSSVLRTAGSPTLSTSHSAAACNALTAFLEWAIRKGDADVQALIFSETVFIDSLEVYYQRADTTKAKPLKQLLVSLAGLVSRNPAPHAQKQLKAIAVSRAVSSIHSQVDISLVKSSMQILDYLLRKPLISISDVLVAWRDVHENFQSAKSFRDSAQDLIFACFEWLPYPTVASVVGRLVASLVASSRSTNAFHAEDWTWGPDQGLHCFDIILSQLDTRPDLFHACEENVLPVLLQSGTLSRNEILTVLPNQLVEQGTTENLSDARIHLALTCVKHLVRFDKRHGAGEGRPMSHRLKINSRSR